MNLGPMELIVILIVALLIFGPKNLPKLGKSIGQTVKNVREGMETDEAEDEPKQVAAPAAAAEVVADSDADDEGPVVFCSKCGAKNPADSAFCSKCGAKLSTDTEE